MKIQTSFILTVLFIYFSACTSDVADPGICFREDILPIFISNCAMSGCHESSKNGEHERMDLTSYEGIIQGVKPGHPLRSKVYTYVKGISASMPPGPASKLSSKDIKYLKIWINKGAPNSSNCITCDTSNYSFKGKIQPVFNSWCVGCHNTGNAGGGYDFSSYSVLANKVTLKNFLGALEHIPGYSPMPKSSGKLPDCDLLAIKKWLSAGNPDN